MRADVGWKFDDPPRRRKILSQIKVKKRGKAADAILWARADLNRDISPRKRLAVAADNAPTRSFAV